MPTFVDNDAKALALAEGWIGAAAGERNFIAMVVSTGIGGGIVLDGRLLGGSFGQRRPYRACGRRARRSSCAHAAVGAASRRRRPAPRWPRSRAGRRHWRRPMSSHGAGTLVGRAVASVVNLLDLPLAVVSGSVALGFGDPFFAAAQKEVELRCGLEFARGAKVVPGGLGDRGPLIGAGCVGWRGLDGAP